MFVWACGPVVMTSPLHGEGRRFDSCRAHCAGSIVVSIGRCQRSDLGHV